MLEKIYHGKGSIPDLLAAGIVITPVVIGTYQGDKHYWIFSDGNQPAEVPEQIIQDIK
jgi:hypothetical protein